MLPHGVRVCHRFGWASSRGLNTMRRPLPASQSMQAEEPVTSEYFPANATAKGLGRVYECLCTAESQGGGFVLVESIRISFVLASGLGFRNQYTHLFVESIHTSVCRRHTYQRHSLCNPVLLQSHLSIFLPHSSCTRGLDPHKDLQLSGTLHKMNTCDSSKTVHRLAWL